MRQSRRHGHGVFGLCPVWPIVAAASLLFQASLAQIYTLQDKTVPGNRSLKMLYTFYVYAKKDAPENAQDDPVVTFSGLVSHSTQPTVDAADLQAYRGIQLSLMRYSDFWYLIDPRKFCCDATDVAEQRCKEVNELLVKKVTGQRYRDVFVYAHTVPFNVDYPQDKQRKIRESGVYILVYSNCGLRDNAAVSGSIVVKNPYGFLPGSEYYKMPLYSWLTVIYTGCAVAWGCLSLRWWKELSNIQNCISAVIFLGLLECFLWYIYFDDWNQNGQRGQFLFVVAILASVTKSIFSYMLVLVASLGWGVTRPYLDRTTITRIQALSCFYIILDVIREVVLSFQHSHSLPMVFVLLCLLPVSILNGVIFYWIFTALSTLIQTLKDRRQTEKQQLFERYWAILILSLLVATAALLYQIFVTTRDVAAGWKLQWLFMEGVPHVLFLVVLVAMMYLWAPHKYSQRYAYSQQIDDREHAVDTSMSAPYEADPITIDWAAGDEEEIVGPQELEDEYLAEDIGRSTCAGSSSSSSAIGSMQQNSVREIRSVFPAGLAAGMGPSKVGQANLIGDDQSL